MGKPSDRDSNYMYDQWGTTRLVTDYQAPRMLREIYNDDITPKRHDFHIQKEIHEKIRNDEYGTEPVFGI
jgi:hypothetical protein